MAQLDSTNILAALQWHYRILQALALDEDHPGNPEDKTVPKYRQIDKVGPSIPERGVNADVFTACR